MEAGAAAGKLSNLDATSVFLCSSSVCVYYIKTASGDGEKIMRFCPSFHIVELMSQGKTPQQACETVVKKIVKCSGNDTEVAVIALDMKVNIGGMKGLFYCSLIVGWLNYFCS